MLCERCKTEITLANLLDAEPDVNRRRHELSAKGRRRVLPPTAWALFEALYAGRDHVSVEAQVTYEDGRTGTMRADVMIRDVDDAPARTAR